MILFFLTLARSRKGEGTPSAEISDDAHEAHEE